MLFRSHAIPHASLLCRTHPAGVRALWRLAATHQRGHRLRERLPATGRLTQGRARADAGDAGYRSRDGL